MPYAPDEIRKMWQIFTIGPEACFYAATLSTTPALQWLVLSPPCTTGDASIPVMTDAPTPSCLPSQSQLQSSSGLVNECRL